MFPFQFCEFRPPRKEANNTGILLTIMSRPHFIMLQRFLPHGPKSSSMHYQIYRNKNSPREDFDRIHKLYAKVVSEDKVLCELSQKNLNAGIFVNGQMHPRLEKGPLYFQHRAREVIREHAEREKKAKREIWPAQQNLPADASVTKEDVELCSGLACQETTTELAW